MRRDGKVVRTAEERGRKRKRQEARDKKQTHDLYTGMDTVR
jgi:hypothetical protein